jgi:hypothetical protein
MLHGHAAHADLIRLVVAIAMVIVGFAAFLLPRCFAGVAGYFARSSSPLDPKVRERLDRVVTAREKAEGISADYGRYLGGIAIALAALEAVRSVPVILPYALFCLAGAVITLLAYLQFHRATEQRVAPLVPRSPLAALPPLLIAAIACSFFVTLAFVALRPERLSAIIVAVSTLLLGLIAWRIADAPALLIGEDPQYEYAVDERVRIGRARNVAALACAPPFVLLGIADPSLAQQYGVAGLVIVLIAAASLVVTTMASFLPLRGRIRVT